MTPPRAVIEALYDTLPGCTECPLNRDRPTESPVCKLCWRFAEKGATAVLAAHYAGEVEGPWRVVFRHPDVGYLADPDDWVPAWYRQTGLETLGPIYDFGSSQADADEQLARRVAHALNWRGE